MMNRRYPVRGLCMILVPALATLVLGGCIDTANVENLPAHIAFVGPTLLVEEGVVETWFGVDDLEGGAVKVDFAVCPDGGGTCLDITPLAGSATLDRVPVAAAGATTPQRVVWAAPCSQASATLVATVGVVDSDVEAVTSAPFAVGDLGACP
jgi:hypothetical protein